MYTEQAPARSEVDALRGAVAVQFGTNWCGYCQRAEPLIESAFTEYADVQRLKVEDGPGRALGRSFRVKLWPTLIFLRNGQELSRIVRPTDSQSISDALAQITRIESGDK